MKLDAAVVKALSIEPAGTKVVSHGGSGFSTTAKIITIANDGSEKHYFMKTGMGKEADVMFKGEHASLNAIHSAVSSLCPQSFAEGRLEDSPGGAFLVTDFLDMSGRSTGNASERPTDTLPAKLAKLHTTSAPIPNGYTKPMFGFPVMTCCGDTEQPNEFTESWADFYANNRLLAILKTCERTNGNDSSLRSLVEKTASETVPRLIGDDHLNSGKGVVPVTVHGDLWSGNKGRGRIGGHGAVEDVVFDPSSCYAHSEYDLGIVGHVFVHSFHIRNDMSWKVSPFARSESAHVLPSGVNN